MLFAIKIINPSLEKQLIFTSMSQTRLEAHYENRTYYFYLISKSPNKISINAYSTEYTFLKTEKGWENAPTNKNMMAYGLIAVMIQVVGA